MNNRAVILGYHHVTQAPSNKIYAVSASMFRQQLTWLKDKGFRVISLSELYQSLLSGSGPGPGAVVLTFDDGLLSQFELALPILREFGFPACFFVIADFVGKGGFMGWAQLREIIGCGMEVGSHGLSHSMLNIMPDERVKEELALSKNILEEYLNYRIDFLSIPRGQFNPSIKQIAAGLGYKAVCVSSPGYVYEDSELFALKRFVLRSSNTMPDFKRMITLSFFVYLRIQLWDKLLFALRLLLGIRLYENIRRRVLKDEYSH
jgi:peptidoglycan/xylan/chitin deacetylase (PgdA/CDA1 family)